MLSVKDQKGKVLSRPALFFFLSAFPSICPLFLHARALHHVERVSLEGWTKRASEGKSLLILKTNPHSSMPASKSRRHREPLFFFFFSLSRASLPPSSSSFNEERDPFPSPKRPPPPLHCSNHPRGAVDLASKSGPSGAASRWKRQRSKYARRKKEQKEGSRASSSSFLSFLRRRQQQQKLKQRKQKREKTSTHPAGLLDPPWPSSLTRFMLSVFSLLREGRS